MQCMVDSLQHRAVCNYIVLYWIHEAHTFAASFTTIHAEKRNNEYPDTYMVVLLIRPYGSTVHMAVSWNPCLVGMLVCDLRQFIKRYKSYTQTPAMLYLQNETMSKIKLSKEKYFDIHANYTWIQCSIWLLVKRTVVHKVVHHTIDKPYHLQRISRLCFTTNKWNKRRKAERRCCRIQEMWKIGLITNKVWMKFLILIRPSLWTDWHDWRFCDGIYH